MLVNVEIKNSPVDPDFDLDDGVAAGVVALLGQRGGRDRVLVSSFNATSLGRVRDAAPSVPTGWLTVLADPGAALDEVAAAGHRAIHPWDPTVTGELVAAAHQAGLAVNVWTVDDPARLAELATWGVDGVITNDPARALAVWDRGTGGASQSP